MSQAEYKRKWRKIQAGEKDILEYNNLEESFNQESSEDVQYVSDKHFDTHDKHLEQNLSAKEAVSSDEETVSSNDFNEDHITENAFANLLSCWVCKHQCSRDSVNELLSILREHGHPDLPKNCRTLLGTPRSVFTKAQSGEECIHLGVENGITRILHSIDNINFLKTLHLVFNIDGVSLLKCSNTQLWPILAAVENSHPFVVSVYCGNSKPHNLSEFLEDLITEINHIRSNGIILDGKHFNIIVKCFTCNAPARQFVKGIKSHTSYNGCKRCQVVGQYISNRVVYQKTDVSPRTDPEFKQMIYNDHQ